MQSEAKLSSKQSYKNKLISSVQYNIDTCEFSIKGERNTFNIPKSHTAHLIDNDGVHINSYQNRIPIDSKFGIHKLHVRTKHSGEILVVDGSPFAYRYSQNTFTSPNMKKAAYIAIKNAFKAIGFKPTTEQISSLKAGDITIDRVDIAVNFILESETEVLDILKQVRRLLIEQRGTTKTCETTVYWMPNEGKEYSISLYAKGPQLSRLKRYNKLPNKSEYIDECKCILRIEVRLRTKSLLKLGLSKVCDWTEDSAQKVFSKYMGRLKLLNITSGPLAYEELQILPNRLRHVLALHKAGCNLEKIYSHRTLQRYQGAFRKIGIDLKVPNQPANTETSLTRILSPRNAIKETPAWLIKAGMAPSITREQKNYRN